jgi:hypothetical protein
MDTCSQLQWLGASFGTLRIMGTNVLYVQLTKIIGTHKYYVLMGRNIFSPLVYGFYFHISAPQ